jgi:hypothetical protein
LLELAQLLGPSHLQVVDVGGDILAKGDEPGLRSPLADALVLAALADFPLAVNVLVAGAGLDGELSEQDVLDRLAALGSGSPILCLSREAVRPYASLFEWHPSEVTGLLGAATMGARGRAEIRDGPLVVTLTPQSPQIFRIDVAVLLPAAPLASALVDTTSLADADARLQELGQPSELDYERAKAEEMSKDHSQQSLPPQELLRRLDRVENDVASTGVDFLTLRRLNDRLRLEAKTFASLRPLLRQRWPRRFAPPLWVLNVDAWPLALRPPLPPAEAPQDA